MNGGVRAFLKLASGGVVVKFAYMPISFVITVLLTRSLNPELFGLYSVIVTALYVAVIPLQVGMPSVILRYAAQYDVTSDVKSTGYLLNWGRGSQLVMSIPLGVILAFYLRHRIDSLLLVVLAAAIVPILADCLIRSGALRGLGKPITGLFPEQVVRPLAHALLLLGFVFLARYASAPFGLTAIVVSLFISYLMAWAFGDVILRRVIKAKLPREHGRTAEERKGLRREWLGMLGPMMVIGAASGINYHMDILLVDHYIGEESAGIYKIALSSVVFVWFGLMAINAAFTPKIGKLFHSGRLADLGALCGTIVVLSTLLAIPFVLVFWFGGEQAISFAFGSEYKAAAPILSVLAIGYLFAVFCGPSAILLRMSGFERSAASITACVSIANIVINVFAVQKFGLMGCAVVTSVCFSVQNIAMYVSVIRETDVRFRLPSLASLGIGN